MPNSSAQQLYHLDEVAQPLESYSSSLMLAFRSPDRGFAIGVGPSILFASGGGRLTQWTGALFFAPCAMRSTGLYLTAGGGFRLYNSPVTGVVGDIVQATSAPTIAPQTMHAEWIFSLGIALDLAVVGDAATSVFGAKAPAAPGASK